MNITFCIPSFGEAKYLITALESIRTQSSPSRAIICVGGEANHSVREYANGKDWIELIEISPDPGMVACWNAAASQVRTDYIGFLADDNSLTCSYSAELSDFLEKNPKVDFVFCQQNAMRADGFVDKNMTQKIETIYGRDMIAHGRVPEAHYENLIINNSIPLEATLFRRGLWEKYGPFNPQAFGSFDLEFLFRLLIQENKPAFIDKRLMNFRWHDGAYSNRSRREHLKGGVFAYQRLEMLTSNTGLKKLFENSRLGLEARLLRFPMPLKQRLKLNFSLLSQGKIGLLLKNNLAAIINKIPFGPRC